MSPRRFRMPVTLTVVAAIAAAFPLAGCDSSLPSDGSATDGTSSELGDAEVTYPTTNGVLMQVTEPGDAGSAAYLGTVNPDGTSVTLTGFEFDTGESRFTVALDANLQATELVMGALRATITWNPDGTCQWQIYANGVLVGEGSGQPDSAATAKSRGAFESGLSREDILACTIIAMNQVAQEVNPFRGFVDTSTPENERLDKLTQCISRDDQMRALAQGKCVLSLLVQARVQRVREQYERVPGGGAYYQAVVDAASAAQTKLTLLYKVLMGERVRQVAQLADCGNVPAANARLVIRNSTKEKVTAAVYARATDGTWSKPRWEGEIAGETDVTLEYPAGALIEYVTVTAGQIHWSKTDFELPAAGFVYDFAATQDCDNTTIKVTNSTAFWIKLRFPDEGMIVGFYPPGHTTEISEPPGQSVTVMAYGFAEEDAHAALDAAATCWGPRTFRLLCQGGEWILEGGGSNCPAAP